MTPVNTSLTSAFGRYLRSINERSPEADPCLAMHAAAATRSGAEAPEYRRSCLVQKRQALGDQTGDYSADSGEEGPP